jgi:hypothetical protein
VANQQQQMTPQQALQFLDGLLAQLALDRAGHAKVQQAVMILAQAITPKEPEQQA